jgi:YjbE family integral membrane protein
MDLASLGIQLTAEYWAALGQIMLINLILSGDNAVVIALACRGLPPSQRTMGIMLGALVAILMRIVFTVVATQLLTVPWLMTIGSVLLFWIAVKLLVEDGEEKDIQESSNVWGAVRTIAIADLVMSLDNVVAIAAAAKGNWSLILIGLATSMPLIIFGATLVMWLLTKAPGLVWAGAALLGWIAGELIVSDPAVLKLVEGWNSAWLYVPDQKDPVRVVIPAIKYGAATAGALFVVGLGWFLRKRHAEAHATH